MVRVSSAGKERSDAMTDDKRKRSKERLIDKVEKPRQIDRGRLLIVRNCNH